MARQYLRITPETTWGTFNGAGTGVIVQLDRANAFTMRPTPIVWTIRSAAGNNLRQQQGSAKTSVKGALSMLCYGSQMATLVPWICATPSGVLGSATIDHAVVMDDAANTTVYRRYLGVMVDQAQFTASEQNPLLNVQLTLTAKQPATITATDFPEPAGPDYPSDTPYLFEQASGGLTLGTSRAEFDSFTVHIQNKLDAHYMASQYLTRLKYCGRDVDWTARFPYATTVDRADLEAQTPVSGSIVLTNGAHTLTMDLKSKNYIAKATDDLQLDKLHMQAIDIQAFLDPTAATPTDFTLTAT